MLPERQQNAKPNVPRSEQQFDAPLGKTAGEGEAEHLRRVAEELGGANSGSLIELQTGLTDPDASHRRTAAAGLGALGDRNAIALLRGLLEGDRPDEWELAVHGLRQSKDRSGWLCLESVAVDLLSTLDRPFEEPRHAFRLLVMGRTKTMDRLFRATDGHSRTIPGASALKFSKVAVSSIPDEMSRVMAMRLGIENGLRTVPSTPEEVSTETGLNLETVRQLEAKGWESVQRPRLYREIRRNYEVNNDRFRASN